MSRRVRSRCLAAVLAALAMTGGIGGIGRAGFGDNATYIGPDQGFWSVPGNWSGAVVPNNSTSQTFDVFINNVTPVTALLDMSAVVNTVTIGASDGLAIQSGNNLRIGNPDALLSNAGTLSLNGSSTLSLSAASNITLSGAGTILLNSTGSKIAALVYGLGMVTNNMIAGRGTLDLSGTILTNNGTISAQGGTLALSVNGLPGSHHFTNNGTLRAQDGTLAISFFSQESALEGTGKIELLDGEIQFNRVDNARPYFISNGVAVVGTGTITLAQQSYPISLSSPITGTNATLSLNLRANTVASLSSDFSGYSGTINVNPVDGGRNQVRLDTWGDRHLDNVYLDLRGNSVLIAAYGGTQTIGALSGSVETSLNGTYFAGANSTPTKYVIGGLNQNTTFAGNIQDGFTGTSSFSTSITKVGSGVLALPTSSTYTGAVNIFGGTLSVNSIADGAVQMTAAIFTENTSVTVSNPAGVAPGMVVVGNGIPPESNITSNRVASTLGNSLVLIVPPNTTGTVTLLAFVANSLGGSTSDAQNLVMDGSTLEYTGVQASTNRLFTMGANGATIMSNGMGSVSFTGTGPVAYGTPDASETLTLGGTNGGTFAPQLRDNGTAATALVKSGLGTWAITNSYNTYSGGTTISGGRLLANNTGSNSATGLGSVIVSNGAFLGGRGVVNGPVSADGGGGIDLMDNQAGTLTLKSGLTVGGAVTGASMLKFEIGGSSATGAVPDLIALGGNAFNVNAGGAKVALSNLGYAMPGQTYTLMTYTNGAAPTNVSLDAGSTQLDLLFPSLNATATALEVTFNGVVFPTMAYWAGNLGANWQAVVGTNTTNWRTDGSANIDAAQFPGPVTDVVFGTTTPGATNLTTTLQHQLVIKSLTVKNGTPAVAIGGSAGTLTVINGITVEAGSNGLTLNNAGVVLEGPQTWSNAAAAPLNVLTPISGNGLLTLAGNVFLGTANSYVGGTTIGGGTITVGNPLTLSSGPVSFAAASNATLRLGGSNLAINDLSGDASATIENGLSGTSTLTLMNTVSNSFAGTLRNGAAGTLYVRVHPGAGVLNLSGANSPTGFDIRGGAVNLTGSVTASAMVNLGSNEDQTPSIMRINGGTLTGGTLSIGYQTAGNQTASVLVMNNGVINVASRLFIGGVLNSYGALIVNGGILTVGTSLAVACPGSAIFDVHSGSVTANGTQLDIGSVSDSSSKLQVVSTFTGGVVTANAGMWIGDKAYAALNVMGTAQVTVNPISVFGGIRFDRRGVLNLLGGTLTTTRVDQNNSAGTINFNGGVLKASAGLASPFVNVSRAYVWSGGAIIDTSGQTVNLSVGLNLLDPTGNGVSSISVPTGTGFVAPPLVRVSGGGASSDCIAIANIDDGGNLTGITITNPGVGYTSMPTVEILGGGGTLASGSTVVTLAPNTGGGLNKNGSGTLTLVSTGNNFSGLGQINSAFQHSGIRSLEFT